MISDEVCERLPGPDVESRCSVPSGNPWASDDLSRFSFITILLSWSNLEVYLSRIFCFALIARRTVYSPESANNRLSSVEQQFDACPGGQRGARETNTMATAQVPCLTRSDESSSIRLPLSPNCTLQHCSGPGHQPFTKHALVIMPYRFLLVRFTQPCLALYEMSYDAS